jgi:hypothetical protein
MAEVKEPAAVEKVGKEIQLTVATQVVNDRAFLHVAVLSPEWKKLLGEATDCVVHCPSGAIIRRIMYLDEYEEDHIGLDVFQRQFMGLELGDTVTVGPATLPKREVQPDFRLYGWRQKTGPAGWIHFTDVPPAATKTMYCYQAIFDGHIVYTGESIPIKPVVFGRVKPFDNIDLCLMTFIGALRVDDIVCQPRLEAFTFHTMTDVIESLQQ